MKTILTLGILLTLASSAWASCYDQYENKIGICYDKLEKEYTRLATKKNWQYLGQRSFQLRGEQGSAVISFARYQTPENGTTTFVHRFNVKIQRGIGWKKECLLEDAGGSFDMDSNKEDMVLNAMFCK